MTRMHQTNPAKPLFIKYAPGATHAPHHPTKEWVDKIHAMHLFDDGYEKLRERIFANQKKLGVIAKDAKLEPWPANLITPWDQLSPEAKNCSSARWRCSPPMPPTAIRNWPGDPAVRRPRQTR